MFARHVTIITNGLDRRRRHRYPVIGPITVKFYSGNQCITGRLEDVSLGGARARFEDHIDLGDEVEIWHPATGRFRALRRWSTARTLGISIDNLEAATHLCVQCLNQLLPKRKVVSSRS